MFVNLKPSRIQENFLVQELELIVPCAKELEVIKGFQYLMLENEILD